jgi:AraC family transcriptional regulator
MEVNVDLILNESRQVYISKINRVQDYIESHLGDELGVQQLARVASFSEYHFQRIFRQITGESLYSFIKRLRLEKAVFLLRKNDQLTIQDIALAVGFSNQASFAKALKERYRVSASVIRKIDDMEMDKLIIEISRNGKVSKKIMGYSIPIELEIKAIDPIRVLYIRHTGAYKGDSDLFMKLFTRLYSYASKRGLVGSGTKWFAVYHDYGDLTEEEKLRLSVCMSIANDYNSQGEFGCMELAGGKYAVGRFLLDTNEYQGAWDFMVSKWLPESGYMPDDRMCFEYYPPQEYENDGMRRMVEIFIPITPL